MTLARSSTKQMIQWRRGLSRVEASEYFGLGVTFFEELVAAGLLPQPVRIGRRKIWDRIELDTAFDKLKAGMSESGGNPWDV